MGGPHRPRAPLLLLLLLLLQHLAALGSAGEAGRGRRGWRAAAPAAESLEVAAAGPSSSSSPAHPRAGGVLGAEPEATTIDGRSASVLTVREAESRAFTCRAAQGAPRRLTWYLNGQRQGEAPAGGRGGGGISPSPPRSSTFVVTARRLDRRLDCSATDPATGRVSSNASVLFDVQFKPEVVELEARYEEEEEEEEPGGRGRRRGRLRLFALVRANPPARLTWVDQDGRPMLASNSSSTFLAVEAQAFPGLANHTIHVQLRRLAENVSLRATNALGATEASVVVWPGLLDTRLELPLLALVVVGAVALGPLLCLVTLLTCMVYRRGKKVAGLPAMGPPSDSNNMRPPTAQLPRANLSLPVNLWLNDLAPKVKAQLQNDGAPREGEEEEEEQEEGACPESAPLRLDPFPLVGYIYRASSMSSDEIWL